MSAVAMLEADSELFRRVAGSIESLNGGDPDPMLTRYADDVVVMTPLYRVGDTGEMVIRGKLAFRAYLMGFIEQYRRFRVESIASSEGGFLVTVLLGEDGSGRVAYSVGFQADGLVSRVTVFAVD